MTFEKIAGQPHVCVCTECGSIMEWGECYKHDCTVKTVVRCYVGKVVRPNWFCADGEAKES